MLTDEQIEVIAKPFISGIYYGDEGIVDSYELEEFAREIEKVACEAQTDWHLASEPPDDHREVLITILDKGKWSVYLGYWADKSSIHLGWRGNKWFFADDDKEAAGVSLWREVPQPPKEADDAETS